MKFKIFILIILTTIILIYLYPSPQKTILQSTHKPNIKLDSLKNIRSKVIIKGKIIEEGIGSKLLFPKIKIIEILKNSTNYTFSNNIYIAFNSWSGFIPESTLCIFYLVPSPPMNVVLKNKLELIEWKLLDGDAKKSCQCD